MWKCFVLGARVFVLARRGLDSVEKEWTGNVEVDSHKIGNTPQFWPLQI